MGSVPDPKIALTSRSQNAAAKVPSVTTVVTPTYQEAFRRQFAYDHNGPLHPSQLHKASLSTPLMFYFAALSRR